MFAGIRVVFPLSKTVWIFFSGRDVVFLFCCFIPGKKGTVLSQETRLQIIPSTDVKFIQTAPGWASRLHGAARESARWWQSNWKTFNSNYMEGGYSSSWEGGEGHDHDECIFRYAEQALQHCLSQRCELLLFETGNRRPFDADSTRAEHLRFEHFASVCSRETLICL